MYARTSCAEPRTTDSFNYLMVGHWEDEHFIKNFRMRRAHFLALVKMLRPRITPGESNFKQSISVEMKVAVTLYYLAHTDASQEGVGLVFGISQASVSKAIKIVVMAIQQLYLIYIKKPTTAELNKTLAAYATKGFPACMGAIDGTRVKIDKPQKKKNHQIPFADKYYPARYHAYTMQVQAICDYSCMFWDAEIGRAGSVHDSRVLRESNVYMEAEATILTSTRHVPLPYSPHTIMPYILGDPGYPTLPWM
eukprot:351479-Chlamydomonas_euryale.AAC.24